MAHLADHRDPLGWPNVVLVHETRIHSFDEIHAWLERPEIPGEFTWESGPICVGQDGPEWDFENEGALWHLAVGFSDADAAFEFKMRWA